MTGTIMADEASAASLVEVEVLGGVVVETVDGVDVGAGDAVDVGAGVVEPVDVDVDSVDEVCASFSAAEDRNVDADAVLPATVSLDLWGLRSQPTSAPPPAAASIARPATTRRRVRFGAGESDSAAMTPPRLVGAPYRGCDDNVGPNGSS